MIINYGIPKKIKTDNRNSFSNKYNNVDATQFGTICNVLDIELATNSLSTAKANSKKYNRIIDNASSIKYDEKYYAPFESETGKIICFTRKIECIVLAKNYAKNSLIQYMLVNQKKEFKKLVDELIKIKPEKRKEKLTEYKNYIINH